MRPALVLGFLGLCSCSTSPSTSPAQHKPFGFVSAESTPALTSQGFARTAFGLVLAEFFRNPSASGSCAVEKLSTSCELVTCPLQVPDLDAGPTPTTDLASAGVITMSGGRQTVTLVPDGGSYPSFVMPQQVLWDGGEALAFHAAGGEVAGFDVTLAAPASPTMTQPVFSPNPLPNLQPDGSVTAYDGGSTIPRSQDLVFQWSGGTPSTTLGVSVSVGGTSVLCTFDAGAGMGVVPSAVLGHLGTGAGGVSANAYSATTVSSADWSTTIQAITVVGDGNGQQWPGGSAAGVGVELQ